MHEMNTPERNLLRDELQSTIEQAFADLPEDLRRAVSLRELDGLSYEDIAETMNCPVGTVRSRIFRAREAIDKRIKPLVGDGA
jgi:RNA polymerase sigma-70 factor (ECF subfamily)